MEPEESKIKLDEIDTKIIEILMKNARASLEEISEQLKVSKSTVHYRIRKLKENGIIEGFTTKINYKKLGYEIFALSCVKAKYHQQSLETVASKIKELEGVENVYVILGEMDFFVMIRAKDKDQLKNIVEKMIALPEIDHSSTYLIISSV